MKLNGPSVSESSGSSPTQAAILELKEVLQVHTYGFLPVVASLVREERAGWKSELLGTQFCFGQGGPV